MEEEDRLIAAGDVVAFAHSLETWSQGLADRERVFLEEILLRAAFAWAGEVQRSTFSPGGEDSTARQDSGDPSGAIVGANLAEIVIEIGRQRN